MGKSKKKTEADFGKSELGIDIARALRKYADILLSSSLKVRSIVVLGSRARGDWKPWSDTDIVIVAENFPEEYGKRLAALHREKTWGIAMEARAYTPNEFIDAIIGLDLTALDAVYEGKRIFDDGFWEKAKETFRITKKAYKLKRIKNGWIAKEPL